MKYILLLLIKILFFSITTRGQSDLESQFYEKNNRSELKYLAGSALVKFDDGLKKRQPELAKDDYYWVSEPYEFITLLEAVKKSYKQITFSSINDENIFNIHYNQSTKYWSLEFAHSKISIGNKFETSFSVFYKIYNIIQNNKPTSSDFFNAGLKCFETKIFSSGIDFFKYCVELDSTNTAAFWNLVNMEYGNKNNKEAYKYLDKILNINPSDYDALIFYSKILNNDNNIDEALMILDKAIMSNPSNGEAYYYRGFIKAFHKKGDGCIDLNRALRLGIKEAAEEIKKFCK